MKPFRLLPLSPGLIVLTAWLAGCFTEIGNAEDDKLVEGNFKIDYSPNPQPLPKMGTNPLQADSLVISQFYLNIREAEFKAYDSVTKRNADWHIWKDDSTTLPVDFAGTDTAARLPTKNVGTFNPDNLVLKCVIPMKSPLKPDTLDAKRFSDKGYIKGMLGAGKQARVFLFQLPQTREIHLEYSKAALKQWYRDNIYHCEFVFFATEWIENVGLSGAQSSWDKKGEELVIFDTGHNMALYQILVDRFYKSFNTTRVFAQVGG